MSSATFSYQNLPDGPSSVVREEHIESGFIGTLQKLKYDIHPDIRDRAALEANFREKLEALNRVRLTDSEFARLLDENVTPDVFTASKALRAISRFTRDDARHFAFISFFELYVVEEVSGAHSNLSLAA